MKVSCSDVIGICNGIIGKGHNMTDLSLKFQSSSGFPLRRRIEIRPGIQLWFSSGTVDHHLCWTASTTAPIFELAYSQKNPLYSELGGASVEIKPGYSNLGFLSETTGHSEYNCGEEIKTYSIWVDPHTFDDFCEAVSGRECFGFRTFQDFNRPYYFFQREAREEALLRRLDMTMELPGNCLNRLLLESQILELLSMNIERLIRPEGEQERPIPLTTTDLESLRAAREILIHQLDCPPSLHELSRLIQMNDFKMKRLFKQYYGKTIYQYIREERMEKAYSLLQEGGHNVSQAACTVGYTNISHFSEAFKRYYGISPHVLIPRKS